jgi:hypothetical protein
MHHNAVDTLFYLDFEIIRMLNIVSLEWLGENKSNPCSITRPSYSCQLLCDNGEEKYPMSYTIDQKILPVSF